MELTFAIATRTIELALFVQIYIVVVNPGPARMVVRAIISRAVLGRATLKGRSVCPPRGHDNVFGTHPCACVLKRETS